MIWIICFLILVVAFIVLLWMAEYHPQWMIASYMKQEKKREYYIQPLKRGGIGATVYVPRVKLPSGKINTLTSSRYCTTESAQKFLNKYVQDNGVDTEFTPIPMDPVPTIEKALCPCVSSKKHLLRSK